MNERQRLNKISGTAQLLSYLRLTNCPLGLLINFNVEVIKDGIRRAVNNFPDSQRSLR